MVGVGQRICNQCMYLRTNTSTKQLPSTYKALIKNYFRTKYLLRTSYQAVTKYFLSLLRNYQVLTNHLPSTYQALIKYFWS